MKTVGSGTYEVRIKEGGDEPRVFCVAALRDTAHVLHAFQKTSRKTPERHLNIGRRRRQTEEGGVVRPAFSAIAPTLSSRLSEAARSAR
jgi:hypothetical protein